MQFKTHPYIVIYYCLRGSYILLFTRKDYLNYLIPRVAGKEVSMENYMYHVCNPRADSP